MGGHPGRMDVVAVLLLVAAVGVTEGAAAVASDQPCESPFDPGCDAPQPGQLPGLPSLPGLPLGIPSLTPSLQAGPGRCEALQVPGCEAALPYTSIGLPNLLGHRSQGAASLLLMLLRPAFDSRCSPDLRRLLCTVLLPPCRAAPRQRLPCRALCQNVRAGCEGLMNAHGIMWPPALACSLLPGPEEGCIGLHPADTTPGYSQTPPSSIPPSPAPTSPPPPPPPSTSPAATTTTTTTMTRPPGGQCEPIAVPLCQDVSYNMTVLPNLLHHHTQEEAGLEVQQFVPLVTVQCSPQLKLFLCTVYVPACTILDRPLPPCRQLCHAAKEGCHDLMAKFGFPWPSQLECSQYPEGPNQLCVGEGVTAP